MKPDWSKAPPWANYLAMDKDGTWVWFENKPEPRSQDWAASGSYGIATPKWVDWLTSLESRQ